MLSAAAAMPSAIFRPLIIDSHVCFLRRQSRRGFLRYRWPTDIPAHVPRAARHAARLSFIDSQPPPYAIYYAAIFRLLSPGSAGRDAWLCTAAMA